jgi:hypothetical protein
MSGPLSAARRALVAFAERQPATQADIDHVMRVLVSHGDWYVPVAYAARAWGQSTFQQMLLLGGDEATPVLSVFTDRESAELADGQPLGAYGGPVPGTKLLSRLDPSLQSLVVNPASPREQQWYIASGGFEIAIGWATAIVAERALANRGSGPIPIPELVGHRYRLLVENPNRAVAQIFLPEISGAVSVCFTASDRAAEFLDSLPAPARNHAGLVDIPGAQLFDMLRGVHAAGLVVNAGAVDQTALTSDDIAEIASRH